MSLMKKAESLPPNPLAKVLRGGIANYTVLIAREGRKTAIDDSAAPIRDVTGKISGVVMMFHDVTEPRSKERARAATHMMSSTSAR